VSFATPAALIALVAIPVLAGLYWAEQRRRRAAAEAFAAAPLQPSVVPHQPGWRRHAPMLAVGAALALLIGAAAMPQRTVAVPVERAAIMLATDISGSMTATDVRPSRLVAAERAAQRFVDAVPARVNVGVMTFNQGAQVLQSPTRDREAVRAAIAGQQPSGTTALGDAITAATKVLRPPSASERSAQGQAAPPQGDARRERRARRGPPAAVVLLSDGSSTRGRDPVEAAREARRLKVPVYTVSLGTADGTITRQRKDGTTVTEPVPPDPQALERVARASGGRAYTAQSAGELNAVYEQLGSQVGRRDEQRQITSLFAGGGLVLLLAGIAMSVRWFGRII
jgi:Ca-activated chloride channel family protein